MTENKPKIRRNGDIKQALSGDIREKLNHPQAAQKTMAAYGDNSLDILLISQNFSQWRKHVSCSYLGLKRRKKPELSH